MHLTHGRNALIAVLAICLAMNFALAFPPGGGHGGGGGGGGGGFHGGGGGGGFHGGGGGGGGHSSGGGGGGGHFGGGGGTAHAATFGGGAAHSGFSGGTAHMGTSGSSFHGTTASAHTPTFTPHTSFGVAAGHVGAAGATHGGSTFHSGGTVHTGTGPIHTGPIHSGTGPIHTGPIHTSVGPHFNPGVHPGGVYHSGYAHTGVYHQAFIGNHPVHFANPGYHPSYMYHNWYHGPWSGHSYGWGWGWGPGFGIGLGLGYGIGSGWGYGGYGYGGYGPYGYWGRPLGWGFGGWGLGTLCYNSGYYPYYNPYYVSSPTIVYNYSNPIPVATQADPAVVVAADTTPDQPLPQADNPDFDAARSAFAQGDYPAALTNVDAAITKVPSDAVLHEFRALVLFALKDYKQAAAVAHSVLAVGPGWDWTTMSSLYSDPDVYTQQLRDLEDYVQSNPRIPESHFLLAYHYMICNHNDAAAGQLQQVVRLMPSDRLAGELLKMVQGPQGAQPVSTSPPDPNNPGPAPGPDATSETAGPPPVDKDLLPGMWSATREDGSKFRLTMTDDGKFTWNYAPPKQKGQEFGGTYTVDGPVLVLEREGGGGALAGTAVFDGNGKFNFKMVGGPPEDKGLDFKR